MDNKKTVIMFVCRNSFQCMRHSEALLLKHIRLDLNIAGLFHLFENLKTIIFPFWIIVDHFFFFLVFSSFNFFSRPPVGGWR